MSNSQQDFENSTQQIKNSARTASTAASNAVKTGNAAINAAKNAPQNIQNAAQAVKNAPENIRNAAEKTANAVRNAPANAANAARRTGNAIRQMPANTVNTAKTMANNVAIGVANAPGAIVNGVKAMPGKTVSAVKKAPSLLGHAAKNIASAAANKVITTITGAAGFLLLILILCAAIATVDSLSSVLGNDEGETTIKGFFKTEEQYNNWIENVFYPNFADTDEDSNDLQFAAVVSAYHYAQTNTSFVNDRYTFEQYLKNFTSGKERSEILDSVSADTGYHFSEDDKKKMIDAMISSSTGGALVDGDASKVTPSGTSDGSTFDGGRGTDRYNKAVAAFVNAYGKACYDYSGNLQCVSVSEWYLVKVYGCHYAFGNGRDIVRNALNNDSDKLIQLSDWTAGAIFSVQGFDGYGHTGYVAKVDKAAGMVWLTEAWGSNGTYHENRPWTLSAFYSYYGNAVSFCIGKDYYNQLQKKAKEG